MWGDRAPWALSWLRLWYSAQNEVSNMNDKKVRDIFVYFHNGSRNSAGGPPRN